MSRPQDRVLSRGRASGGAGSREVWPLENQQQACARTRDTRAAIPGSAQPQHHMEEVMVPEPGHQDHKRVGPKSHE